MSDIIYGLHHADSFEVLKHLPDNYVDTIATDPPYGLTSIVKRFGKKNSAPAKSGPYARASAGFMGKAWDGSGIEYNIEFWEEAFRVCRPGAQVFSFGGARTYHRMATALEAAGFIIFDMIVWIYGTGYAKSLDISKSIDRKLGAEREEWPELEMKCGTEVGNISKNKRCGICKKPFVSGNPCQCNRRTKPITEAAKIWEGWGTALKPSQEPIVRAIKPLDCKTYIENVLKWGTGAINIEASKIGDGEIRRFPANVILSHSPDCFVDGDSWDCPSECPVFELDKQSGISKSPVTIPRKPDPPAKATWSLGRKGGVKAGYDDEGGASRFYYISKPSQVERNVGLHDFESKTKIFNGSSAEASELPKAVEQRFTTEANNIHPTVKPIEIMRHLVRLGTRPGGLVLDPFLGSGTTAIACVREGMECIGIEKDEDYHAIAEARIVEAWEQRKYFESLGRPPEAVEEAEYTELSGARMSDREARKKSLTPRMF